ncbi:hypothetical protein NQ318_000725, partial [Aromia moschata]
SGRPRLQQEKITLDILLSVRENPIQSSKDLATSFDVSQQSVKKLFKREKLRPYKLKLVHELNEDDFDRRADFCEDVMERCNNNNNFARNILFSDKPTLNLNGVNRHNSRYWSSSKEAHTQNPLNFEQALLEDVLLIARPFFIDGNFEL